MKIDNGKMEKLNSDSKKIANLIVSLGDMYDVVDTINKYESILKDFNNIRSFDISVRFHEYEAKNIECSFEPGTTSGETMKKLIEALKDATNSTVLNIIEEVYKSSSSMSRTASGEEIPNAKEGVYDEDDE